MLPLIAIGFIVVIDDAIKIIWEDTALQGGSESYDFHFFEIKLALTKSMWYNRRYERLIVVNLFEKKGSESCSRM